MRYASGEEAQVGDVVTTHLGHATVEALYEPEPNVLPGWKWTAPLTWRRDDGTHRLHASKSGSELGPWFWWAVSCKSGHAPTLRDAMLAAEEAAGLRPETPCPPELQCGPLFGNFVCDKPKGHAGDHRGASFDLPRHPSDDLAAPVKEIWASLPERDGTEWPARTEKPQAPTRWEPRPDDCMGRARVALRLEAGLPAPDGPPRTIPAPGTLPVRAFDTHHADPVSCTRCSAVTFRKGGLCDRCAK